MTDTPTAGHALDWTGIADPHVREARRAEAYRTLYSSPLGRLILLDQMIEAGVFGVAGFSGLPGKSEYDTGQRDRVVMIAELAGVTPGHMAEALTTGNEGYLYDDRHDFPEP